LDTSSRDTQELSIVSHCKKADLSHVPPQGSGILEEAMQRLYTLISGIAFFH